MREKVKRLRVLITGQVQGVGFRPYVFHIANKLQLTGWVQNTAAGVVIEVQGKNTDEFSQHLIANPPVLAKIDTVDMTVIDSCENDFEFQIIESVSGIVTTKISADVGVCDDCIKDLFDSKSRYHFYPFLNCTHCGPRLTVIKNLPYDRTQTALADFPLCDACHMDYHDPRNRRYHAQATACSECGPKLSSTLDEIVTCIRDGKILALKGLGGYQLICDARNENAISQLRQRKHRIAKPFAVMVADLQSAKCFVKITAEEEALLTSNARPIVLLSRTENFLPDNVAPGLTQLGMVLPYMPLHYLLFDALNCKNAALIFTSANLSGKPLMIDDQEAFTDLSSIADKIVSYNRNIVTRVDDSVLRIIDKAPYFIRRARGYVPSPIKLSHSIPVTIGLGGYLKNTFCITRDDEAFVSQHIGDLDNANTIEFFHESLTHTLKLLAVEPEYLAHDLHPDFYTTQCAQQWNLPNIPVQHHHAHLASVAAEHRLSEPVLGLVLDGYGYGEDGNAWGGECLLLANYQYQRLGSLTPMLLPGGNKAAQEPWRMAAGVLYQLARIDELEKRFAHMTDIKFLITMMDKKINTPTTSSCGRLFDAVSALLGVQLISDYEGHASMRLESLVTKTCVLANSWHIKNNELDLFPLLEFLLTCDAVSGANYFHGTLIAALADWILSWVEIKKISTVLLSGGCFLNRILAEGLTQTLAKKNVTALLPRQLPPNDGGLSLGQAWIAGNVAR